MNANRRGYQSLNGKMKGYFRYGQHGKKYYYITNNRRSIERAYQRCLSQARAIEYFKHKG